MTLHGSFLNIYGVGTHIMGAPGIGKSELTLALLYKHHQFIADDAPIYKNIDNKIIGKSPLSKPYILVRGIGMIDVIAVFGPTAYKSDHRLELIINLDNSPDLNNELVNLEGEQTTKDILGSLIPIVTIPIINPRNLQVLVETIVKKYLLKCHKEKSELANFEELLQGKIRQAHL